jgi:hypothetical protein
VFSVSSVTRSVIGASIIWVILNGLYPHALAWLYPGRSFGIPYRGEMSTCYRDLPAIVSRLERAGNDFVGVKQMLDGTRFKCRGPFSEIYLHCDAYEAFGARAWAVNAKRVPKGVEWSYSCHVTGFGRT